MNCPRNANGKKIPKKMKYGRLITLVLILTIFLSPFFLNALKLNHPSNTNVSVEKEDSLHASELSKDDYEPILSKKLQSLGEIIVTSFEYEEFGFINYSSEYPGLEDDLNYVLNLSQGQEGIQFQGTNTSGKVYNNIDLTKNSKQIKVSLREQIDVSYNRSVDPATFEEFLIYRPKLGSISPNQLKFDNRSSGLIENVPDEFYSFDTEDFINFEYYDFFGEEDFNFTMYLDYTFNIPLINWTLNQKEISSTIFQNESNSLFPEFSYGFNITTNIVPNQNYSPQRVPTDIPLGLNITLPDKDLIFNHSLTVNKEELSVNNYLNEDNVINVSLSGNNSIFFLNFNTEIKMNFKKPVANTWAIDRLIQQNNIRERIYFPTITSGPEDIYFYISIIEDTISTDQVRSIGSLFGRDVSYSSVDTKDVEDEIGDSLVFTEQASVKQGIKIKLPYIVLNETVPFSIKYQATENLRIIVTDNINMPAQNLRVKVYYQGKEYGSYISVDKVLPLADLTTNANGEININNAPNGFYRVEVYQGNNLLANKTISSYQGINSITTDIPHFPTTIIIFSLVSTLFLVVGAFIYIRNSNENRRS